MQIDKDLESKMNKMGVFVKDPESFTPPTTNMLQVEVDLGLTKDAELDLDDLFVEVVSKRGVSTYFAEFSVKETDDLKILTFAVAQCSSYSTKRFATLGEVATSFLDLCWFVGNEAVPENYNSTTLTPLRPGAVSADLGYMLPARFLDSFIDAMGKVNDIFFNGALEDAMVYGVRAKTKEDEA